MKHVISKARTEGGFARYIVVVFLGLVALLALVAWASIAAIGQLADAVRGVDIEQHLQTAKDRANGLAAGVPENCGTTIKAKANIGAWLDQPISQTFGEIKRACIDSHAIDEPRASAAEV